MKAGTDKRVAEIADKIIGRGARDDVIEKAIANFDRARTGSEYVRTFRYGRPRGKPDNDKVPAKSLALALAGVEKVLARADVRRLVRKFGGPLGAGCDAFPDWEKQLIEFRERLDRYATWPLAKSGGPHKPGSPTMHRAIAAAAALLKAHGRPPEKSKSKVCSIAAVLYDRSLGQEKFEHYYRAWREQFLSDR